MWRQLSKVKVLWGRYSRRDTMSSGSKEAGKLTDSRQRLGSRRLTDGQQRLGSRRLTDGQQRLGSRRLTDGQQRLGSRRSTDSWQRLGSGGVNRQLTKTRIKGSADGQLGLRSKNLADSQPGLGLGIQQTADWGKSWGFGTWPTVMEVWVWGVKSQSDSGVSVEQLIDCTRTRNRLEKYRGWQGRAMGVDALWMHRRNVRKREKRCGN